MNQFLVLNEKKEIKFEIQVLTQSTKRVKYYIKCLNRKRSKIFSHLN